MGKSNCTLWWRLSHGFGLVFPNSPAVDLMGAKKNVFFRELMKKEIKFMKKDYVNLDHGECNCNEAVSYMCYTQSK